MAKKNPQPSEPWVKPVGMVGIQTTGQMRDAGGGEDTAKNEYMSSAEKDNAKFAAALASEIERNMAGYMKNDAPRHGLAELPPRPQPPNWKKEKLSGGGSD